VALLNEQADSSGFEFVKEDNLMPPRPVNFDPEQPLRSEKHEHFARLRVLLVPVLEAAKGQRL
jgi:hypothetical protein